MLHRPYIRIILILIIVNVMLVGAHFPTSKLVSARSVLCVWVLTSLGVIGLIGGGRVVVCCKYLWSLLRTRKAMFSVRRKQVCLVKKKRGFV
jgi:hypothetical protein